MAAVIDAWQCLDGFDEYVCWEKVNQGNDHAHSGRGEEEDAYSEKRAQDDVLVRLRWMLGGNRMLGHVSMECSARKGALSPHGGYKAVWDDDLR